MCARLTVLPVFIPPGEVIPTSAPHMDRLLGLEQLMRQIMHYDHEFRREEATSPVSSHAKH